MSGLIYWNVGYFIEHFALLPSKSNSRGKLVIKRKTFFQFTIKIRTALMIRFTVYICSPKIKNHKNGEVAQVVRAQDS
jgi:hypothetical protein